MQKRKLGNSGISIAPLMFGGNVFGWTADEAMSFKLQDGFVGAGLNAIEKHPACAAAISSSGLVPLVSPKRVLNP